ncbi:hypothetical protein C7E12_23320, partial [Stenotrophomonas maltophilia]
LTIDESLIAAMRGPALTSALRVSRPAGIDGVTHRAMLTIDESLIAAMRGPALTSALRVSRPAGIDGVT